MDRHFRHEYKYTLSRGDYLSLRMRLRAALHPDPHAGPAGEYTIRSVYFDNVYDKALREKLDGVNVREKFRIRYYNGDTGLLRLERKSKLNGLCSKASCVVTAEEAGRLFRGDTEWVAHCGRALLSELRAKMEYQQLRPKVVVDYIREPFTFPAGNVRLTLDRDIRTGAFRQDLLEQPFVTLPTGGDVLLEVKYDQFLPEFIRDLVQVGDRRVGAYSKYAVCRRYG